MMNRLTTMFCALLVLSLMLGSAVVAVGKSAGKTEKITAEIVSIDALAKKITIKSDNGKDTTAEAANQAAFLIRDLNPGDKAVLTCVLNDKGDIAKITHFKIVKK